MIAIIQDLYTAQKSLQHAPRESATRLALVQRLRQSVPAPILAHYLRLVDQGRPGVALVRHGVCSECHIRLPSGLAAALASPHDVHLCEQCGCFLLLPEEDRSPPLRELPKVRRRRLQCAVA